MMLRAKLTPRMNTAVEEWEQVVIHRDVKASNVLLDAECNGRLGDFGLARLCRHGTDPQTTRVAGTWGYLSPDHLRTGRATTATDIFAFGVLILEVACGRRPIQIPKGSGERAFVMTQYPIHLKSSEVQTHSHQSKLDLFETDTETDFCMPDCVEVDLFETDTEMDFCMPDCVEVTANFNRPVEL
ncbi:hypothetical protein Bca4012_026604 [Brassica carinata]